MFNLIKLLCFSQKIVLAFIWCFGGLITLNWIANLRKYVMHSRTLYDLFAWCLTFCFDKRMDTHFGRKILDLFLLSSESSNSNGCFCLIFMVIRIAVGKLLLQNTDYEGEFSRLSLWISSLRFVCVIVLTVSVLVCCFFSFSSFNYLLRNTRFHIQYVWFFFNFFRLIFFFQLFVIEILSVFFLNLSIFLFLIIEWKHHQSLMIETKAKKTLLSPHSQNSLGKKI